MKTVFRQTWSEVTKRKQKQERTFFFLKSQLRAIQALKASQYLNLVVKWLQTECTLFLKGNFADAQPA